MPKDDSEKPKVRLKSNVPKGGGGDDKKLQRERFIEAARKAEADESGDAFESAFKQMVPERRKWN